MKTHGLMMGKFLTLMLFMSILVLFTVLPISFHQTINILEGKYFWSFRKPPGKKRKVKQESDWKKYYGSCPELKEDIKNYGKEIFSREIISLHITKGLCNYEETKLLFLNNVLSESLDNGTPAYYNSNILGRYMRKDYGNFRKNSTSDS